MKRKGINYDVGIEFHPDYHSRPTFEPDTVRRELGILPGNNFMERMGNPLSM